MRGATLINIRNLTKVHIRNVIATNTAVDNELNLLLKSMQDVFCSTYDWQFLEEKWDLPLVAGTRYYALPTSNIRAASATINFDRPLKVAQKHNGSWCPVGYGIGFEEMNCVDSDDGEVQDPVQKYSLDTNVGDTSDNQIEVWPIPSTTQTLRFIGQRVPRTFTSDSDKAELDDLLLALFVAAEVLDFRQQANAGKKLNEAQQRLISIRGGQPTKRDSFPLGRRQDDEYTRRSQRIVAVAAG